MTTTRPLYASTLGRIWLMIRLDYYLYRWHVLRGIGLFALAAFVVPRIPLFFGEDLQNFSQTYVRANMYDVHLAFGYISVFFGWLAYCNRRTQHSRSIAFAHTPVRLGEQAVSSLVFALAMCVLMWLAVQLNQLVSWLTLPVELPLSFDLVPETDLKSFLYAGYQQDNTEPVLVNVVNISHRVLAFLALLLGSISFRNIIKGWFISSTILVIGTFLVFSPQIHLNRYLFESRISQESASGELTYAYTNALEYERLQTIFTTSLSVLLPAIMLIVGWLLYRKLKTIAK
ncbi:MAG: hypothetical protein Q4A64_08880 [Porphyromonadaceae bacterium]|nr:hypothetical protein [Porphyromonadaceae bacterium]